MHILILVSLWQGFTAYTVQAFKLSPAAPAAGLAAFMVTPIGCLTPSIRVHVWPPVPLPPPPLGRWQLS
jgi:hypothetical protein